MAITYAGKIENGEVVDVIVGTSAWAIQNIGGEWHQSSKKIPFPGTWDSVNGFRPISPFPSWIWDGTNWQAPVPYPGYDANWDEANQRWVAF